MTDGKNYYTVIEMAEHLSVPRTTINDWLNRYSTYVDFMLQGKRRVYSETTLQVFQAVNELRAKGVSSFEIESELTKRFPVHAEPASHDPAASGAASQTPGANGSAGGPAQGTASAEADSAAENPASSSPAPEGGQTQQFALMQQRQADEIGHLLNESFQSIAQKMETMEKTSHRSAVRMHLLWAGVMILLIAIAGVTTFAVLRIASLNHSNEQLARDAAGKTEALKQLENNTVSLIGGAEQLKKNIELLQKELSAQNKRFESAMEEARKNMETTRQAEQARRDAEVALERQKLAAEKLNYLRNLERLSSDNEAIVKELQQELEKARQEKPGSAPAPAAK